MYRLALVLRQRRAAPRDEPSIEERQARAAILALGELTWRRRVQEFSVRDVFAPVERSTQGLLRRRGVPRLLEGALASLLSEQAEGGERLVVVLRARSLRQAVVALRLLRRSRVPVARLRIAADDGAVLRAVADQAADLVLVTEAVTYSSADWLECLISALADEPEVVAAQPAIASPHGDHGALTFDLIGGAPSLVSTAVPGEPRLQEVPVIDERCVLVRAAAFRPLLRASAACTGSLLAASVSARRGGRRFVCVGRSVGVRTGPPSLSEVNPLVGPVLRRRILSDLVAGGGLWCRRTLAVSSEVPWVETACGEQQWRFVGSETAQADVDFSRDPPDDAAELSGVIRVPIDSEGNADHLAARLRRTLDRPSFCVELPVETRSAAVAGGDLYLAGALARSLRRLGCEVAIRLGSGSAAACFDVRLHMHGRRTWSPSPSQVSVLWYVSHPEGLPEDGVDPYDLVLCASPRVTRALRERGNGHVHEFLQFTDPTRFSPQFDASLASDVLFVGNWRGVLRDIVWDAVQLGIDVTVYGRGWDRLVPEVETHPPVENRVLPRLYSSAKIVLADHWPDMRSDGFVANRVFDALACGALVLSDHVPELDEILPGGVLTYRGVADLGMTIEHFLRDPDARSRVAASGRAEVLRRHTADVRAAALLGMIDELSAVAERSDVTR